MTDETIQRIVAGEFQEVHACLRAGNGRQLSAISVVAIRFERDRGFEIDRPIELVARAPGADGRVYFETADGTPIAEFSVSEFTNSTITSGRTYTLDPIDRAYIFGPG